MSRIVATPTESFGVITSSGNVHYVVTEFSIASLHGKSVRERVFVLIRVAHSQLRDELIAQIRKMLGS